ncbi:ABC transporter ATP-binding protein [Miniphocaeibacter halophilus]|uniref:ABC transporter ATP-binding protein n=1 Tax=Miniphocaeibacter halophilus TaxID=2931922 RepID=A0AC61MVF6_9FIRM|nr:ABC transporter ATP-binding protein [Miniphocaeibacter halophilus]QQK08594.1 ABC transporter ATP-binding protein [Miniphocaeibacter halophilus]
MLEIKNLSFAYNEELVLENISFKVKEGTVLGLLGKNGAGKTTLFKIIFGMLNITKGEVLVDNIEINKLNPLERAKLIAYIPQSHYPTFNHRVLNVVEMGANTRANKFTGVSKEEKYNAYEKLKLLGISHLANRGYKEISGGERQLVLVARALMQDAKVLVMDEPTSNLDYGNQILILNKSKELASLGYTIIQSTHHPQFSYMFFDEVLVLHNKRILIKGNPKEVLTEGVLSKIYNINLHIEKLKYNGREEFMLIPEYKK